MPIYRPLIAVDGKIATGCKVNGKKIDRVTMIDTDKGICEYYVYPFEVIDEVAKRETIQGRIEVLFNG